MTNTEIRRSNDAERDFQNILSSFWKANTKAAKDKSKPKSVDETLEDETSENEIDTVKKGTKRSRGKAKRADDGENGSEEKLEPTPKQAKVSDSLSTTDFESTAKTNDGRPWNLKLASWNINGVRAWLNKGGLSYLTKEKPDVLCVQETKCSKQKIPKEAEAEGYKAYWYSAEKEGYSGIGMYTKTEPISITYGLGIEKHDNEGRVMTAEFDKFYLVTAYVPNSGQGLVRLKYRTEEWDVDFRKYLKGLEEKKPVVLCGDLNVAHLEIGKHFLLSFVYLKNPKSNKRNAGFTDEERAEFTKQLEEGFIDSFRTLYPDQEEAYTFWSNFRNAREKNIGWRLDYFVLSQRLKKDLCDSLIRKDVKGSDHCPVVVLLSL
ncbi:hypothetical protein C0Q70_10689 [Pomacea canaliculata]|uniref:DNA-(apurinic or apyrimidinic site) endonuclease n=1 Tax=Pomacea canaliculata TaxID=400727 RepID=A0A2T7P3V6_POMCA|nr:hypothetical protein C0Q70_10689 [Pomacea canaliculata]